MVERKIEVIRIAESDIENYVLGEHEGVWLVRLGEEIQKDTKPLIRANMLRANNGQPAPPLHILGARLAVEVDNPTDYSVQKRIIEKFSSAWEKLGGRVSGRG